VTSHSAARFRAVLLSVLVAATGATQAGCEGAPGTALRIDGETYTEAQVSQAVEELQTYVVGADAQYGPAFVVNSLISASLVNTVLDELGAEHVSADDAKTFLDEIGLQVSASLQTQGLEALPKTDSFSPVTLRVVEPSVLQLLIEAGSADVTLEAISSGYTYAMEQADIQVNPRFGAWDLASGTLIGESLPWLLSVQSGESDQSEEFILE
jgi:hypothetical protein